MGFIPTDPDFDNRKNQDEKNSFRNDIRQEIVTELYKQFLSAHLTPSQIIIDDEDLQKILKISKRQTAILRERRLIAFSQPIPNGKVYYLLQDAIDFINNHRSKSIYTKRRI